MLINFLRKTLPSTGLYCVGRLLPSGKFAHTFQNRLEDAYSFAIAQDEKGESVFLAQFSFWSNENRKGENANCARSFWLDIDCGPEDPYASQKEGILALKKFCLETKLPFPSVVNSGNGLYAYWSLEEDVSAGQWEGVAGILKALCVAADFKVCPSRTADKASVLRPVGAHNRKDKKNPKPVTVILDKAPVEFVSFAALVREAAKEFKIEAAALNPPEARNDFNFEFDISFDGPPSLCEKIAQKCNQVRTFKDTKGNVSEPLWYALIGVLRYAEDGERFIHEWSAGYPGYTWEETQSKIEQHSMPPTTCHYISGIEPKGCLGCAAKTGTPLSLGRTFTEKKIVDKRCSVPDGFMLTEHGVIFKKEGEDVRVYPYDIYPISISQDESLGYETVKFRHYQPHQDWQEFSIKSSLVHDPKTLLMTLHDNHVQVTGADEKKLMVVFMERYIAKLRASAKMAKLSSQMGWKITDGKPSFVLGDRLFSPNEPPTVIGFAHSVPEVVRAYKEEGDYDKWKSKITNLNTPDMMGHAFALLAGGFGAPLMHFTGYAGATICCLGKSGIGKTVMGKFAQSIYGDCEKLTMQESDTKNARVSRLGVYGSLPFTIDEVSNIDKMELSELVHKVTHGRDKARLTKAAVERVNPNTWQTVAMVSSNHSLIERLSSAKGDANAEMNRIFEYTMHETDEFVGAIATDTIRTFKVNYGHAGSEYIQYLLDNYEDHAKNLDKIIDNLNGITGAANEERFWSAVGGIAIYAAMITNKLGIGNFRVAALRDWIVEKIRLMRNEKKEINTTAAGFVGDLIDKYAANGVITSGDLRDKTSQLWRVPTGPVVWRFDKDTSLLFFNRKVLRGECSSQFVSFSAIMHELNSIPYRSPILKSIKQKCLGSGVANLSGAMVGVVTFDLSHPVFGRVAAELIKETNEEFKQKQGGMM